jgi:putative hydrolase of the HAD superfamily
MGVIYRSSDDVAELLVPFVQRHGGTLDTKRIEDAYIRASLGELSSAQFWAIVGVPAQAEEAYLAGHELSGGLMDFLKVAKARYRSILCLSNDVSEWSVKLRKRFGLDAWVDRWYISGDLRCRKPSRKIYEAMLASSPWQVGEMVLVDDRSKNLLPARELGMGTILFDPSGQASGEFTVARNFDDILAALGE